MLFSSIKIWFFHVSDFPFRVLLFVDVPFHIFTSDSLRPPFSHSADSVFACVQHVKPKKEGIWNRWWIWGQLRLEMCECKLLCKAALQKRIPRHVAVFRPIHERETSRILLALQKRLPVHTVASMSAESTWNHNITTTLQSQCRHRVLWRPFSTKQNRPNAKTASSGKLLWQRSKCVRWSQSWICHLQQPIPSQACYVRCFLICR